MLWGVSGAILQTRAADCLKSFWEDAEAGSSGLNPSEETLINIHGPHSFSLTLFDRDAY